MPIDEYGNEIIEEPTPPPVPPERVNRFAGRWSGMSPQGDLPVEPTVSGDKPRRNKFAGRWSSLPTPTPLPEKPKRDPFKDAIDDVSMVPKAVVAGIKAALTSRKLPKSIVKTGLVDLHRDMGAPSGESAVDKFTKVAQPGYFPNLINNMGQRSREFVTGIPEFAKSLLGGESPQETKVKELAAQKASVMGGVPKGYPAPTTSATGPILEKPKKSNILKDIVRPALTSGGTVLQLLEFMPKVISEYVDDPQGYLMREPLNCMFMLEGLLGRGIKASKGRAWEPSIGAHVTPQEVAAMIRQSGVKQAEFKAAVAKANEYFDGLEESVEGIPDKVMTKEYFENVDNLFNYAEGNEAAIPQHWVNRVEGPRVPNPNRPVPGTDGVISKKKMPAEPPVTGSPIVERRLPQNQELRDRISKSDAESSGEITLQQAIRERRGQPPLTGEEMLAISDISDKKYGVDPRRGYVKGKIPEKMSAPKQPWEMTKDELISEIKKVPPQERPSSPHFQEYEKRGLNNMGSTSVAPQELPPQDIGGFESRILPINRDKVVAQMNEEHSISGKFQTRKQYIEDSVAGGATIGIKEGQRALVFPDGKYMLQKNISKTALDYADYLAKSAPQGEISAPIPDTAGVISEKQMPPIEPTSITGQLPVEPVAPPKGEPPAGIEMGGSFGLPKLGKSLSDSLKNALGTGAFGGIVSDNVPKETVVRPKVRPKEFVPPTPKESLRPYTAESTEPLKVVKTKVGGTMPVFQHELDALRQAKDLAGANEPMKHLKLAYENPIRIFDDLPPVIKETLYDQSNVAETAVVRSDIKTHETVNKWKKSAPDSAAINAHLVSGQRGGERLLSDMGVTARTLSPEEMRVAGEIRNGFDKVHTLINKARELSGADPLKFEEGYSPWMRLMDEAKDSGIDILRDKPEAIYESIKDQFIKTSNTAFPFAKKRVNYSKIPIHQNIYEVYRHYMHLANKQIALAPVLAKGRAFLEDFTLDGGKKWNLKDSAPTLSLYLGQWLDKVAGVPEKSKTIGLSTLKKFGAALNKNLAMSTLGFNAYSALIQPTSIKNAYVVLGEKYTALGVKDNLSPAMRNFAMANSNKLPARQFGDVHMSELMEKSKMSTRGGKVLAKLRGAEIVAAKKSMVPLQFLDMEMARTTWLGAYRKATHKLGLVGKKAFIYADDVVTRTQASASAQDIAPVQRTVLGKILTIFNTYSINDWNFLSKEVVGWNNSALTGRARAANLVRLGIGTVLISALYEDVFKLKSPMADPVGSVARSYIKGERDVGKLLGVAGLEAAEQVPVVGGSMRYASAIRGVPMPGVVQLASDAGGILSRLIKVKPGKITVQDLQVVGKTLGIPGTGEVMKYIRRRQAGLSHFDALVGVKYEPKTNKKPGRVSAEW